MRRILLVLAVLLFAWPRAANAEVEIHFHSKDFASTFPHGFIRLTGTDDATGQPVDKNFGFTPVSLSPSILFGPVAGIIQSVPADYLARSDRHFSLKLTDEQHRTVLAIVEKWRRAPQPSYRLNDRNCVHFVAEVATALGLHAPPDRKLIKKPKSFLRKVTEDNLALIEQWPLRYQASRAPVPALPPPASATATPAN